jgi:hypothetical protein
MGAFEFRGKNLEVAQVVPKINGCEHVYRDPKTSNSPEYPGAKRRNAQPVEGLLEAVK